MEKQQNDRETQNLEIKNWTIPKRFKRLCAFDDLWRYGWRDVVERWGGETKEEKNPK